MSGALGRIAAWLRRPSGPDRSRFRLSDAEALEIASRAAPAGARLVVIRVTATAQGRVWVIGTPTVGSGHSVSVDDATGEIIESGRWGVR